MKIRFDISSQAGLRVLDGFIDGKIIEVQGLNGIGKSVAAQLLEIISGEHVFQRQSDFESLRSALKSGTISITGLERECKSIQATMTPHKWAFTQDYQIRPDTVGEFFVDGIKSSAETAMSLISTRIIRGNDTIISQMREVLIRNREDIIRKHAAAKQNFETAQGLKQEFLKISPEDNITVFKRAKESLLLNKAKEGDLQKDIGRARSVLTALRQLLEVKEQIEELRKADFPTLAQRITATETDLSNNLKEQEELMRQIESVQTRVAAQSAQSQQQANDLAALLLKLESEEEELRGNLAELIQRLDVPIDDLAPSSMERHLISLEKTNSDRIDGLDTRWKEVSVHLELAGVGHSLVFRLIPAVQKGFGGKIIGQGEVDRLGPVELSIAQLEQLINNRLVVLDREASELPEGEYKKEADSLRSQRQHIRDALSAVRSLRNKINLKTSTAHNLNRLQISIDKAGAEHVQTLKKSLEELRQRELYSRIELTRMRETHERLSSYPNLTDLSKRYESEISRLNLKEDVRSVYESFQRTQATAEASLEEVQRQIQENGNVIRKLGNDFLDELTRLARKKEVSYFMTDSNSATIDEAAASIEQTHLRMNKFVDDCEAVHNFIGRVYDSINIMIQAIQGKESKKREYEDMISTLREIYSNYFVSVYQAQEFLDYVFKGFKNVVRFDMENNEVVLETNEGQEYSRPLSVFSSGERAFAFSLAMIEITAKRKESNKILVLDEFGALLDYERSEVLKRHLKEKVENEKIADKVIVILPAREDFKERVSSMEAAVEAQRVKSPVAERELTQYRQFQSDLETKGYFQYVWNS